MNHSSELNELATALAEAQSEFIAIPKTAQNPFFKSSYADLATVVQTATPILAKHGLSVSQHIGFDGQTDTLTTWLLHTSGQYLNESMRLYLNKQDAQSQGSATTYAKRYSYMSVLGLVADDDDDGNRASRAVAQAPVEGIVDLSGAVAALNQEKRKGLRSEWEGKFGFPTNAVPKSQAPEAMSLIKAWS